MDLSRPSTRLQQEEIRRFLATGDSDPLSYAWEGGPLEGGRRARNAMISALLAEVRRRSGERPPTRAPGALDLDEFVRSKVEPMVRGLFPRIEQAKVLSALERSITFVTEDTLEAVLRERSFLHSAWDIANLYLGSVGAELLGEDAPRIVGLSEETSCFVSPAYFDSNGDRFADFVLHEAAHIFHNCKRVTIGLPARRGREWLLEIDFRMRETFAYACEAYGRILELGPRPTDRRRLLAEHLAGAMPRDDRVDEEEYCSIVTEAVGARNGWKRILGRCAPGTASKGLASGAGRQQGNRSRH